MRRRSAKKARYEFDLAEVLGAKLRPPVAIVLGSPHEAADLASALPAEETVCYQMDLYQAERLGEELAERGAAAKVVTAADLWDLPADFQTVLYPAPEKGERTLKIDMIEQAFHVLRPHGTFIVLSPYEAEQFFPAALKKVFGRVHTPAAGGGAVLWCQREGDRPRRRHEMTFHARVGLKPSLTFLSRPGTFSYGRFDNGARALVETMQIEPSDRVVDLGCGCGANGIFAARQSAPVGWTAFVDSNVRAVALAEHNARACGLTEFEVFASSRAEGPQEGSFDVVLANPPYYGQSAIAALFIRRGRALLRPGGRLYLVTKQPDQVGPLVAEAFGMAQPTERRGYIILSAWAPGGAR
jgi:16S rRNA (guanine1207-N2)-methyltransferase